MKAKSSDTKSKEPIKISFDISTQVPTSGKETTWTRIADWIENAPRTGGGTAKQYTQALTDCFNIEQARQDKAGKLPGKLSFAWGAVVAHTGTVDHTIIRWARDRDDIDAKSRIDDDGHYKVTLIGDPKDFSYLIPTAKTSVDEVVV